MKSGFIIFLVLAGMVLSAHAGILVIKETETAIIIEYTGDPTGKEKGAKLEELPAFKQLATVVGRVTPEVEVIGRENEAKAEKEAKWKDFSTGRRHAVEKANTKRIGKTSSEKYGD